MALKNNSEKFLRKMIKDEAAGDDIVNKLDGKYATEQILVGLSSTANVTTTGSVVATAGFAIGDVANAWIDDATHGSGSTQLFIGNSTIDVTAPSDERLKQNIVPSQVDALGLLEQIGIVDYDWKDPAMGTDRQFGWIAQQVASVLPKISEPSAEGTYFVKQNNLVPYLLRAIQQLSARVAVLEGKQPAAKSTPPTA